MAEIRINPKNKQTVIRDARGNLLPWKPGGTLVDEFDPYWNRLLVDEAVKRVEEREPEPVRAKAAQPKAAKVEPVKTESPAPAWPGFPREPDTP